MNLLNDHRGGTGVKIDKNSVFKMIEIIREKGAISGNQQASLAIGILYLYSCMRTVCGN